jgi:hypothetical protein
MKGISGCPLAIKAGYFQPARGAKDADTLRRANEELWLLDRRERNDEPPAAVQLDIRVRGAPCVSFFPRHDLSFRLIAAPAVADGSLPEIHDSETNGQG